MKVRQFINDNTNFILILIIAISFITDTEKNIIVSGILLVFVLTRDRNTISFDVGDLFLFLGVLSWRWYMGYTDFGDDLGYGYRDALFYAAGFTIMYQLGKNMIYVGGVSPVESAKKSVIVIALYMFVKALIADYAPLLYDNSGLEVGEWMGINRRPGAKTNHEYWLVMIASLLIFFILYSVRISLIGIIGYVLSALAVLIALTTYSRISFVACLLSVFLISIGLIIEEKSYRKRSVRITIVLTVIFITVFCILFYNNVFGMYEAYLDSSWSEDGGLVHNFRFSVMSQAAELIMGNPFKENLDVLTDCFDNDRIYAYNSWLDIGRVSGIIPMLLMIAFAVCNLISMVNVWIRSKSIGKYAVIAAFIGISFLLSIEPVSVGNLMFLSLYCYLGGLLRGIRNSLSNGKKLEINKEFNLDICVTK